MRETNTNFDAKHGLDYKTPLYAIQFDGHAEYYVTQYPTDAIDYEYITDESGDVLTDENGNYLTTEPSIIAKPYIISISGNAQTVKPEEGSASIGSFKVDVLDKDNEITELFASDPYYFHRKKTTILAGYKGMATIDMLTVMVGWVTNYDLATDGLTYSLDVTDPKKWLQRKIFRGAEDSTVTIQGNPMNILLAVLMSTGDGTNGDYDWYDEENGLGLTSESVDVDAIEAVRDNWFPGDSHYMQFTIKKRIKAKEFIENEILKTLNCYPIIDGQGRFSIKPFKPPIAALEEVQSFSRDNIIGIPAWSANLESVINEVEIFYDYDADNDNYDNEVYYIDSDSLNNRGPGKSPITIKTKGLQSSFSPASITGRADDILITRKNRIFGRWATPPILIKLKAYFSRWLSDPGDIVPITHSLLPDMENGVRGLDEKRMEIINRQIDWKRGNVTIDMLDTGFDRGTYGVISPTMTVLSSGSSTSITVSAADAVKYENFTSPEIQVLDAGMRQQISNITITNINTTTGVLTVDDMGATSPTAGWILAFADYDDCTNEQKLWGFIADSSDDLGTSNDDAHLISP